MKTRFPRVLRQQIEEICYEYGIQRISWDIHSECSKYFSNGKTINIRKNSDESFFHEIIHFILLNHNDEWVRKFYGAEHEIVAEYFKFEIIYPLASDNLEDCLNEWNEWRGEWYLIINIEDKEIVDWASTKSLSLKDLYQVLKVFREYEINEFSADLRESTSYRLVKIAEKCKILSILEDTVWKWENEYFHKCLIRINRFFRK